LKVLVLGGGGKEHALVWKLSESKHIDKVYCCPGNAGIAEIAECIDVNPYSAEALIDFVKYEWIDFTIVSSEEFISKGMVNAFEREGCKALGPNTAVSRLRSSRVFAKNLMRLYRIPSPDYKIFSSYDLAEDYIRLKGAPIVIRTDGHSKSAGVFSATTVEEAMHALKLIMKDKIVGDEGNQVIVEELIRGERMSFIFFSDGNSVKPVAGVQKYAANSISSKTRGGFSPAASEEGRNLEAILMSKAIAPLSRALVSEGITFKGILSLELILNDDKIFISDIDCNFAPLEAQIILPRLKTDLTEIFIALLEQRLSETEVECLQESSACVAICGAVYPEANVISGLQKSGKDVFIFHEGTAFNGKEVVATGEEVLSVTALGPDLSAAVEKADHAVQEIHFEGMRYEKLSNPGAQTAINELQT
jgi:phosphoribosylamine---glycine ligase